MQIAKISPNGLQVWFWDEVGFNLRVIKRKRWTKKRSRKKISGQRRKGSFSVMGGVRFSDKKRIVDLISKGTGDSFLSVLERFYEALRREWEESGNEGNSFEENEPKIVIVLDNASIHKRRDILEKIKEKMPNVILEFLPEYSPDYNLIELVWHSVKEYISNRLFGSIEELKALVYRLLNEGELVINWGRNIKNKGNAISAI